MYMYSQNSMQFTLQLHVHVHAFIHSLNCKLSKLYEYYNAPHTNQTFNYSKTQRALVRSNEYHIQPTSCNHAQYIHNVLSTNLCNLDDRV